MANKDVEYKMSTNQSNVINIKEFTAATTENGKLKTSSYSIALYISVLLITVTGFFPEQLVAISREAARFIIP